MNTRHLGIGGPGQRHPGHRRASRRGEDLAGVYPPAPGHGVCRYLPPGDFRSSSPRFSGENLDHNLGLVEALRSIATAGGTTVSRIAIAWVLSRGDDIVPLIGARRRDQPADALAALDLTLTPDDLAQIEQAIPPDAAAGERYAPAAMAHLDSERVV